LNRRDLEVSKDEKGRREGVSDRGSLGTSDEKLVELIG